jgi:hypothetical protein
MANPVENPASRTTDVASDPSGSGPARSAAIASSPPPPGVAPEGVAGSTADTRPGRTEHPLTRIMRRSRVRHVALFGAGLLTGGAIVGGTWMASSAVASDPEAIAPATFDLRGSMTLVSGGSYNAGRSCQGSGGYSDIAGGASVTVYDAQGVVVATGSLGPGASTAGDCVFPISVPAVPDGSNFYQVEVSHRGKVTYDVARARTGQVHVSLG